MYNATLPKTTKFCGLVLFWNTYESDILSLSDVLKQFYDHLCQSATQDWSGYSAQEQQLYIRNCFGLLNK